MTSAYATLANLGYKVNPKLIQKVEDMNGNVLYENKNTKEAVLNSSLAYIMNENLTSTYNYNFVDYNYPTCHDIKSTLKHKYSIKTGTTNSDHLVFGYNSNIVVGMWSGYDDNSDSELYNGKELRYMWRDIVEQYLKDKPQEETWYNIPENVVGVLVDPITGIPANKKTKKPTMFYYIKGTEPTFKDTLDDLIPTIKEKDTKKKN
jgi:membrane peptidoglycan carboxypeptidase